MSQILQKRMVRWCSADDPVARKAVTSILLGYFQGINDTNLEKSILKARALVENHRAHPAVRSREQQQRLDPATGEVAETIIDPVDDVDALVILFQAGLRTKGAELTDLLMLLALDEFRRGHPGLGLKAFYIGSSQNTKAAAREWYRILHGRRKGGKKSSAAKKEEHAERDAKICEIAVQRLRDGHDRSRIVQDLATQHNIGIRRVQQLLKNKCPGWPTRTPTKRNHT